MTADVDDASQIHGRVRAGAGSRIVNSVVRGPAVIGEGCEIRDAYIGPYTSVGDGVRGRGERGRALDPAARSAHRAHRPCASSTACMGCNAVIRGGARSPLGYRVMLGDNSEVDL